MPWARWDRTSASTSVEAATSPRWPASTPIGNTPSRDLPPLPAEAVHLGGRAGEAQGGRREVAQERRRVEADEVRAEHPLEDALALRQDPEDLGGGERDVEEEADARLGDPLAEHPRHQHELVVVDPDEVAGLPARRDRVGEARVHRLVRVEVADLRRQAGDGVVEERPQHAVRVAFVVARHLVRGERHRDEAQRLEAPVHLGARAGGHVGELPGPADPEPAEPLVGAAHPGGEPAAAADRLHAAARGGADGDGEPVRDDEEARHRSGPAVSPSSKRAHDGRGA